MQILAHRGLIAFPENSPEALKSALQGGFGIELDVHRTQDRHVVVTHDRNLSRLYGVNLDVTEQTLQKIAELGLVKNHPIAALKEVLELFKQHAKPETLLAVQIKDSTEEKIAELVVQAFESFSRANPGFNIYSRALVFDPTKEVARQLRQLQPKLKIAMSVGEDELFTQHECRSKYPSVYAMADLADFPHYDFVWADEWQGSLLSAGFVKKCHDLGKKVFVVSPELHVSTSPAHPLANDMKAKKQLWKNLKEWSADGICTDHPNECKEAIS
ncbi:glycerophosphodiester phosphodiesterase family protein [Candidatus Woesearchaeota archaeon]|nr:glycerophosphodiester phosphodiesterase family protein [Candidatus Woesearchaeota archaeon]